METFVIGLVFLWIVYMIWRGYREEMAPPVPMVDNGHGALEPVCPHCRAKLVTVTRSGDIGLTGLLGWLCLIPGIGVFLLAHWPSGAAMIIVGILLVLLGKSTATVLSCPAWGKDAKRLA